MQAWEEGDVARITAMLTDDAIFAMPPSPSWYRGRTDVGAFLAAVPLSGRWRWCRVRVRANGQLAFGVFGSDAAGRSYVAHAGEALTIDTGARIAGVTSFHEPEAFARLGLPDEITP